MNEKKWYESKTLNLIVGAGLIMLCGYLGLGIETTAAVAGLFGIKIHAQGAIDKQRVTFPIE